VNDNNIDLTRLDLLLNELRLPGIKHVWSKFAEPLRQGGLARRTAADGLGRA
jgi:hypothetical protein